MFPSLLKQGTKSSFISGVLARSWGVRPGGWNKWAKFARKLDKLIKMTPQISKNEVRREVVGSCILYISPTVSCFCFFAGWTVMVRVPSQESNPLLQIVGSPKIWRSYRYAMVWIVGFLVLGNLNAHWFWPWRPHWKDSCSFEERFPCLPERLPCLPQLVFMESFLSPRLSIWPHLCCPSQQHRLEHPGGDEPFPKRHQRQLNATLSYLPADRGHLQPIPTSKMFWIKFQAFTVLYLQVVSILQHFLHIGLGAD